MPSNSQEWVEMQAGESRTDLSLILGVDLRHFPDKQKILIALNLWAVKWEDDPEFLALLQVEEADT